MLYKNLIVSAALFASGIHAMYENLPPTRGKRQAPEGMVMVHTVRVGDKDGNLKFSPESLQADPGSMVQFHFWPKNHSVAQSTFEKPCEPISQSKPDTPGINSGFMPMSQDATEMPVWTVMINSTDPMWLYCGQTGHCQKGMVMAINVPQGSNKTLDQFKANAAQFSGGSGGGYGSGSGWGSGNGTGSGSGSGTGSLPTATSGSGSSPNANATGTSTGLPADSTFNAAAKPMADAAGYMALLVAGYALVGL